MLVACCQLYFHFYFVCCFFPISLLPRFLYEIKMPVDRTFTFKKFKYLAKNCQCVNLLYFFFLLLLLLFQSSTVLCFCANFCDLNAISCVLFFTFMNMCCLHFKALNARPLALQIFWFCLRSILKNLHLLDIYIYIYIWIFHCRIFSISIKYVYIIFLVLHQVCLFHELEGCSRVEWKKEIDR